MKSSYKRLFLIVSLLVLTVFVVVACSPAEEVTEAPPEATEVMEEPTEDSGGGIEAVEATSTPIEIEVSEYGEVPMLAEMVAAGDLPPVEERLPMEEDILVVAPVDGIGEYGGTWHNVANAQSMATISMVAYEGPVRWKRDYTGYEVGLLREFEQSDDGTEMTWHWRRGIKWSDGVEFIPAVDMAYWWELANNEDFAGINLPFWLRDLDGEPAEISFPDDYTMVFKWKEPHFLGPFVIAQGFWEWNPWERPFHFLSQFDPNYTDGMTYDDLEQVTRGNEWLMNVEGYPCLHAWCPTKVEVGERTILTRNPYYWKVDPEGNQLPYIDYLDTKLIPDDQVRLLELSQGKYEASFRGTRNANDIPFLLEQAADGEFSVWPGAVNGAGGWPTWFVNMNFDDCETYPDSCEEIRALLQNQDFRIGLSHALDRQRLIDVAWGGIGYPTQATISPQSWHFSSAEGQAVYEEWKNAYVEHDPELAAEYFEAAGFVDADGDGLRDLPSGEPFTLVINQTDWSSYQINVDSNEVYKSNLEDLGVNVLINDVAGTPEQGLQHKGGLFMLMNTHASELDVWTFPDWLFPLRGSDPRSFPLEGKYYETGGAEGWEPQPNTTGAYEMQQLYTQGIATADVEERHKIVWEAIRVHIDLGPFMIGGSGDQQLPVVVKNGFHGIPDLVILGPWAPGSPGNLGPEQFWMEASLR